MKRILQFAMVLLVGAVWTIPMRADEPRVYKEGNSWVQSTTGTVAPLKILKVLTEEGSVTVNGDTQHREVTWVVTKRVYTGSEQVARRRFDSFTFHSVQKAEFLLLEGACSNEESAGGRMSVEITVMVPRDTNLVKVETQGGNVAVHNLVGRVDAGTAGGTINMTDIGGAISARTSGGGISIGEAGGELKLESAGGNISIHSANGRVHAQTAGGSIALGSAHAAVLETAGGNIQVDKCAGELKASTAGGSVDVGDVTGPAILETNGGSIRVGSATGLVKANTSGGGIRLNNLSYGAVARTAAGPIVTEFVAHRGNFSDSVLETSVGDVVVYLPPDLPVTIKATIDGAMGHSVHSDFPEVKINSEGGDYGPREIYAQGAINGGGPLLKITTTSGNIELRRGKR